MERKRVIMEEYGSPDSYYNLYNFYCKDCDYKFNIYSYNDNSKYVIYEPTREDKEINNYNIVECPKCGKILFSSYYVFCDATGGCGYC